MNASTARLPIRIGFFLAAIAALSGCAHNSLYFGTKNSIGAEVSGTTTAPTQVSVSYQRSEVALIPSKTDGSAHSVYGSMDYDFSWFDGLALAQVFATGEAATAAAAGEKFTADVTNGTLTVKRAGSSEALTGGDNQGGRLFFATNTKAGLSLDLGQSIGQTVPSFLFGYRRDEATIVPIADANKEVNSVFADLSIVIDRDGKVRAQSDATHPREEIAKERLPGSTNGIRIQQRFATGRAAILVATTDENRAKLAGAPVTAAVALDESAANQDLRARAAGFTTAQLQPFAEELQRLHPGWTVEKLLARAYPDLPLSDIAKLKAKLPSP